MALDTLDRNLGKLEKLLSLMDSDTLTKEDFVKAFENVVNFVVKIQKEQQEAIKRIEETHQLLLSKTEETYRSNHKELRGQVNDLFVGDQLKRMDSETKTSFGKLQGLINESVNKKFREVDERMSKVKDGNPGPEGPPGPQGPMPTEHLELMKEVKAELLKVKEVLSNRPQGKAMGRAKVPMPRTIDLTADQNGVARVFTIPPDTVRIHGGLSSQFPFAISSSDISRSGNQITLNDTIAPRQTGQTLLIFTDALFYP